MSFIPHRLLNSDEVARALRHNGGTADYVSFKLPRRFGTLDHNKVGDTK